MDYVEVSFEIQPMQPWRDVLIGQLAEIEFESFVETETGLQAYIQKELFNESDLQAIGALNQHGVAISHRVTPIKSENWNAVWEADFEPIIVNDQCIVRAPFHPAQNLPFEIVISPKMSFGTGHHETTWLMMKTLLGVDVSGKEVLDMGSGTGVLAILAEKMGASKVLAVDVDDWAYENAIENTALNNTVNITVEKGNVSNIQGLSFHIILANINKNVLLQDMNEYASALKPHGKLLISGFFEMDVPDLLRKATTCGLQLSHKEYKNHWACIKFEKG
jgi:ribosomal protein L11 methyltransferase